MFKQLSKLAAATLLASPLAAQWSDGCQLPVGYNPSFWDECGQRFYGEIDYLLWYANQEGTSFGTNFGVFGVQGNLSNTQSNRFTAKDEFFRNNWDSGVRAVLGYKPPCRTWDVRGAYVYFSNQSRRGFDPVEFSTSTSTTTTTATNTNVVINAVAENVVEGNMFAADYLPLIPFQFLGGSGLNSVVSNLSAKWNLNFNQADIEFGREFYVACDVTIRPFFGLRGLWVDQKYNVRNTFTVTGSNNDFVAAAAHQLTQTQFITSNFEPCSRFDGFGARAGFDASITLWNCLDLFGNLAGSILWGNAKTKEKIVLTSVLSSIQFDEDREESVHSHHTSVLNLDFGFGFRWNQWMNCGRNLLSLKFAWEQHVFTNMNQLQNSLLGIIGDFQLENGAPVFDRNIYRGDLSLSGFVFGVSYLY